MTGVLGQRRVVWALALLSTVGYGSLYYAQPLLAVAFEHTCGWSRTQTSLAFTLALLVAAFLAPAVGRRLDLGHGRPWLVGGALLGSGAFVLLALTSSFLLFMVGWLLTGVAMTMTFYEAVFTVLGQQVAGAARSRATLVVTLLAGLASTLFVPLTTALLGWGGLRLALTGLSALLLLAGLLIWRILPAGGQAQLRPATTPFVPDKTFYRLAVAFTLSRVVTVGVGLQLAPLLLASGKTPAAAALLTGLMGLAALPGRMIFLPLLGRWGARTLTGWLLGLLGTGALLLHLTASLLSVAGGIILFGLASGALTLARTELLALLYPPELFGTVNGLLARPVNLSQAITPFCMGLLFTASGGYGLSLSLMAGLAALSVWSFLAPAGVTHARAAGPPAP